MSGKAQNLWDDFEFFAVAMRNEKDSIPWRAACDEYLERLRRLKDRIEPSTDTLEITGLMEKLILHMKTLDGDPDWQAACRRFEDHVRSRMPQARYDVNLFAVVNVKVPDVPAGSPEEAIHEVVVNERIDWDRMFRTKNLRSIDPNVEYVEFADEFSHFLVRETGEEQGRWYGPDGNAPPVDPALAQKLFAAAVSVVKSRGTPRELEAELGNLEAVIREIARENGAKICVPSRGNAKGRPRGSSAPGC